MRHVHTVHPDMEGPCLRKFRECMDVVVTRVAKWGFKDERARQLQLIIHGVRLVDGKDMREQAIAGMCKQDRALFFEAQDRVKIQLKAAEEARAEV